MANITVKSIPGDLYVRLKESARANHRSINGEIIYCLEQYLRSRRIDPDEFPARADALRDQAALLPVTGELLRKAKAAGRP